MKRDSESVWLLQVVVPYVWTLVLGPGLQLLSWMRLPVHFCQQYVGQLPLSLSL